MTQQELEACQKAHEKISSLEERIVRLRSQAERLTQILRQSQGKSKEKDKLAAYVAVLEKLEQQRAAELIDAEKGMQKFETWLETLPVQQAKIMRLRYEKGLPWREISRKTHFSIRHCTRIHEAALRRCC